MISKYRKTAAFGVGMISSVIMVSIAASQGGYSSYSAWQILLIIVVIGVLGGAYLLVSSSSRLKAHEMGRNLRRRRDRRGDNAH